MSITINLSEGKPYFTQRNNIFKPGISCQVTAAISALVCSDIKYYRPENMQPEDYLYTFFDTPECIDFYKKNYKSMYDQKYRPQEVHDVLAWGINKFVGKEIDTFRTNVSLQELVWQIVKNRKAIILSTRFTSSGHVVTLTGVEITEEMSKNINNWKQFSDIPKEGIINWIIDDPYGNYKTGYKTKDGVDGTNGNDIKVPPKDFLSLVKNVNSELKFAHMFKSE